MRLRCQYMMDKLLLVLCHMREFPAIATADILARSAQPYRIVIIVQVTAVQVVFPPPIVM
ncbi:hypothetical protein N9L19_00730 [bacterium]|nr:hypothetical protein [bacterium]